eukprot:5831088-Amphidinium_carterae.1
MQLVVKNTSRGGDRGRIHAQEKPNPDKSYWARAATTKDGYVAERTRQGRYAYHESATTLSYLSIPCVSCPRACCIDQMTAWRASSTILCA